jgi:5'-deoxynucleotidase YfbR-like HD superfamily hydrolase
MVENKDQGAYNFKSFVNLHPIHNCNDGFFNTHSGRKIDLNNPTVEMIDVDDIEHALANYCRFGGHSKYHYSVAQHSILVAFLCPDELKFAGLMHDATEAYLGDVIKPLKVIIGDVYKKLEDKFDAVICETFGLTKSELLAVKIYDKQAIEIEHNHFFKGNSDKFKRIFSGFHDWTQPHAKRRFKEQFDAFSHFHKQRKEIQHEQL